MSRIYGRLRVIFLGVFFVVAATLAVHNIFWVRPQRACEAHGGWWSNKHRECGRPIDISEITGRPKVPAATTPPQSRP